MDRQRYEPTERDRATPLVDLRPKLSRRAIEALDTVNLASGGAGLVTVADLLRFASVSGQRWMDRVAGLCPSDKVRIAEALENYWLGGA